MWKQVRTDRGGFLEKAAPRRHEEVGTKPAGAAEQTDTGGDAVR